MLVERRKCVWSTVTNGGDLKSGWRVKKAMVGFILVKVLCICIRFFSSTYEYLFDGHREAVPLLFLSFLFFSEPISLFILFGCVKPTTTKIHVSLVELSLEKCMWIVNFYGVDREKWKSMASWCTQRKWNVPWHHLVCITDSSDVSAALIT